LKTGGVDARLHLHHPVRVLVKTLLGHCPNLALSLRSFLQLFLVPKQVYRLPLIVFHVQSFENWISTLQGDVHIEFLRSTIPHSTARGHIPYYLFQYDGAGVVTFSWIAP
jgi:hypothetical protein